MVGAAWQHLGRKNLWIFTWSCRLSLSTSDWVLLWIHCGYAYSDRASPDLHHGSGWAVLIYPRIHCDHRYIALVTFEKAVTQINTKLLMFQFDNMTIKMKPTCNLCVVPHSIGISSRSAAPHTSSRDVYQYTFNSTINLYRATHHTAYDIRARTVCSSSMLTLCKFPSILHAWLFLNG